MFTLIFSVCCQHHKDKCRESLHHIMNYCYHGNGQQQETKSISIFQAKMFNKMTFSKSRRLLCNAFERHTMKYSTRNLIFQYIINEPLRQVCIERKKKSSHDWDYATRKLCLIFFRELILQIGDFVCFAGFSFCELVETIFFAQGINLIF